MKIQHVISFAQIHRKLQANAGASKAEANCEHAGIDGQVLARAAHPAPPLGFTKSG